MKKIFYLIFVVFSMVISSCYVNKTLDIEDNLNLKVSLVKDRSYNNDYVVSENGDMFSITFSAVDNWTIYTDSEWLTINKTYGEASNNVVINVTCEPNYGDKIRTAMVELQVGKKEDVNMNFIQKQMPESIVCYNGDLIVRTNQGGRLYPLFKQKYAEGNGTEEWGTEEWNYVKSIVITGVIDARDFSTIKWNFRNVEYIDISNTKIVAYEGEHGTDDGYNTKYEENVIPMGSFFYWLKHLQRPYTDDLKEWGMKHLKAVKLPNSLIKLDKDIFHGCVALEEIYVPEGVIEIGCACFRHCHSLKKIYLPSTLKYTGNVVFTDIYNLEEVHIAAKNRPEDWCPFGDCLDYWNSDMFPNSGYTVDIGFSLVSEGDESCYHRMTNATLYVPKGCKDNYKDWEIHFKNIVEEDV